MTTTKKVLIGLGVASVVGLFFVLSVFSYVNGVYNQGVQYETRLSALYESNQNYLSQFTLSWHEQMGLVEYKTAMGDSIISNAVTGRYGEDGFSADGAFFSAITEAYPNVDFLNSIDEVRRFTESGRTGFRGQQDILLDNLRSFEQWRRTGLIRNLVVDRYFPTNNLQARIGGQVVATGEDALTQIRSLVQSSESVNAFTTGVQEPMSRN